MTTQNKSTKAGERTQHTPGPWIHIPRARDGHVDLITDREGNRQRAFIQVGVPEAEYPILDEPHDNHQTANAHLIAAAPELLEACKRLVAITRNADAQQLKIAIAAIDKAEGRAL